MQQRVQKALKQYTFFIQPMILRENCVPVAPPEDMPHDEFVPHPYPVSVLLITRWYGGDNNGVGILTETLTQALRAKGNECVVIELLADGVFPQCRVGRSGETIWGVCLRVRPQNGSPRGLLAHVLRSFLCHRLIRRLVRTHNLNIAHIHYASPSYSTIASALRSMAIPWMVTFHGSDLRSDITDPECRAVMNDLVTAAGAVSTVSNALCDVAVSAFPEAAAKTSVVHNSVAVALVEAAKRVASDGLDVPVVLFLGNLFRRKGVDVLLRAWADLVHSGRAPQPWKLVIAGAGPELRTLTSFTENTDVSDRVQFVGFAARADLAAILASASIMVVPSRAEPFGLVAAEGQVFGRPVIASDTGGLREVVQNGITGLLVPPDDAIALATALASLIADPARRLAFGRAAHQRAMQYFSPARMAREYLSLYSTIIAARS